MKLFCTIRQFSILERVYQALEDGIPLPELDRKIWAIELPAYKTVALDCVIHALRTFDKVDAFSHEYDHEKAAELANQIAAIYGDAN